MMTSIALPSPAGTMPNMMTTMTTTMTTTTTTPVATASGLIAMLSENDPILRSHALRRLLACVDTLWHEVAECLPELEAIAEGGGGGSYDFMNDHDNDDDNNNVEVDLETREIAAAVASRVFFHLEEPVQALRLALESGKHFDVVNDRQSAYVERLVAAAVEAYVKRKQKDFDHGLAGAPSGVPSAVPSGDPSGDPAEEDDEALLDMDKLQQVVHSMFERCYADSAFGHALGVAFESREAAKVSEILNRLLSGLTSNDSSNANQSAKGANTPQSVVSTLRYALDAASTLIPSKHFRNEALTLIAQALRTVMNQGSTSARRSAAVALTHCMQLCNDAPAAAEIITQLLDQEHGEDALLGLQLSFDIVDAGDQAFVNKVAASLPHKTATQVLEPSSHEANERQVELHPDGTPASSTTANEQGVELQPTRSDQVWNHFDNAKRVLTGGFTSELALSFLYNHSDADKLIMLNLKKALEERGMGRNSVLHNCAVATHAYLNAGTTNDSFLRDHLDWMKKASNWAKFSATASMGVIHAGHTTEAMTLLEPYLPPSAPSDDPTAEHPTVSTTGGYAEGGSLFALGLIHGSHAGSSTIKRKEASHFLRMHLRNSHSNEVISHGAALGVGLTSFGSADLDVVNELKELLYTDSAVAGEAASIAIGMVLVGSGAGNPSSESTEEMAEIIAELRNYARETQHEKIIRGIAICLALVNFGQEENADAALEEMRGDRDPILRYGAMYGLALAYCGTGSNKAIRILLHTAVSDVSDDVRMAAVIGLALVLHKTPERVPELVRLLLESFNPHVRYASCMAVGIAMAGSGDSDSIALLEPMLTDMTDYVRQGALLGTSMIYMQQSDTCNHRKIKVFRDKLATTVSDKHQTTLTKMGAILSTGLIDCGGRNCALSLGSRNGFTKMTSATGLVLWLQHWHWYPLMHMLSLAITPTCTIGLNKDFKYPKKFEIDCHAKPSVFAYPKKLEEKKEEKKKRVETVALSTTAKNKARLARKRAKEVGEHSEGAMDVDKKEEEKNDMDAEEDTSPTDKPKKKREPEPTSFRISNPSRITLAQSIQCSFDLEQRYRPIRPEEKPYGVIMLTDSTPGESEELGAVRAPAAEDEADPPEPFEWTPPDHPDLVGDGASDKTAEATAS